MRDRSARQGTAGRAGRAPAGCSSASGRSSGRPEGSGQRPWRSGSLVAISTATAAKVLATSLYDDPAAGLGGDAPAGLDDHPSTDCEC